MEPMLTMGLRAARKAAEKIDRSMERIDTVTITEKGTNDFVTEVDQLSEKEVIYHLKKAYPEHAFLGEESGRQGPDDAEYEWIIDPIDGTTNFIHSIPHFAVSLACKYRGKIEHGIVLDVAKREEFTASRGKGAAVNGRRIRVTDQRTMHGALMGTGIPFSGFALENMDAFLAALKDVASQTAGVRRIGSAALDLAYVAAGRFDGFWEMNLKPWDIAAGSLLVTEAGGLVSDFKGGANYLESGNIVCATPKLFKPLLQIVGKHMGHIE